MFTRFICIGLLALLGACATPIGTEQELSQVGESGQAFVSIPRLILRDIVQLDILELLHAHGVEFFALSGATIRTMVEARVGKVEGILRPVTDVDLNIVGTRENIARFLNFRDAAIKAGLIEIGAFGDRFIAGDINQAIKDRNGSDLVDMRILPNVFPAENASWKVPVGSLQIDPKVKTVQAWIADRVQDINYRVARAIYQIGFKLTLWRERTGEKRVADLRDIATWFGIEAFDARHPGGIDAENAAMDELFGFLSDELMVPTEQLREMLALLPSAKQSADNTFAQAGFVELEAQIRQILEKRPELLAREVR